MLRPNRIGSSFGNERLSPHFRVFSGPTILAVSPYYVANLVEIPLGGTRENEMGDEVDDEARDRVSLAGGRGALQNLIVSFVGSSFLLLASQAADESQGEFDKARDEACD